MKYKVGDKVRVRSDLVVNKKYGNGYLFNRDMSSMVGLKTTITHVIDDEYYLLKDVIWNWIDEMLEPVEETFKVGDVVYVESGKQVEIAEKAWLIKYDDGMRFFRRESQLSKTKPLQKITRKELADKGYELVD